ncbi:uncharacterized protein V3H82_003486 [Fundulus diaphanus]
MWRQQVKQRLDAAEEQRHQILDAAFSPEDLLHTSDVQQMLKVKEAPEEQRPGEDQLDPETLPIKEEQEEIWISQEVGPLSVKEEADSNKCPLVTASVKSEDDEEKPLFSQLHQMEDEGLPTSSSADQIKAEPDEEDLGGGELSRKPDDLNATNSSETEDSEDEADLRRPDCGSETEDSEDDWKDSRAPESQGRTGVSRSLSCSGCGQLFDNQLSLQCHMTDHSTISSSVNETCFNVKKNVDISEKAQKGVKCFSCNECGKSFDRKNHLNKHLRVHTGEKPFGCDLCGQHFSIKSTLNSHIRIHTGEKPFGCDVCGHRFSIKSSLKKHIRIHTGEKPFACDVCGHRFSVKSALNMHKKTHTGEKPFSCDVCGQRFSRKATLNLHLRNHAGQKQFVCDVCGKGFNDNSSLKKHTRIHTGEKPFGCDICGKNFNDKSTLKKHMKIHIGCNICGKTFNQRASLNIHMRIHTEEKHMVMILLS